MNTDGVETLSNPVKDQNMDYLGHSIHGHNPWHELV
jgi:hypothetical protein